MAVEKEPTSESDKEQTLLNELISVRSKLAYHDFFPSVPPVLSNLDREIEINGVRQKVTSLYSKAIEEKKVACMKLVELLKQCEDFNRRRRDSKENQIKVEKGETLDLLSLLTCGGKHKLLHRPNGSSVKADSLVGKNVFLCCFNIPMFWFEIAYQRAKAIFSAFEELIGDPCKKDLYSLVVVARMRPGCNEPLFFRRFISSLPAGCLTVPFLEDARREFICHSVGLRVSLGVAGCILSPDQRVLQRRAFGFMPNFGADAFPFTDERLKELAHQCLEMQDCLAPFPGPLWKSLGSLLGCKSDPSRFYLHNNINPEQKMSIAQLEETLVAVYLCAGGYEFVEDLIGMQKECRQRKLDLEIILVYDPYLSNSPPSEFQERVNVVLQNFQLSCWVLPFSDSVTRRLVHFRDYPMDGDWLIVAGSRIGYVDSSVPYVIRDFGIDTYPFTRKAVFERELKRVQKVTLNLLMAQSKVLRRVVGTWIEKNPWFELLDKSVILFFGRLVGSSDLDLYLRMLRWYNKAKENNLRVEVIYVCIEFESDKQFLDHERVSEMPWLVCPFDKNHSEYLSGEIFKGCHEKPSTPVLFGDDGTIRSLYADAFLFNSTRSLLEEGDTLRQDIKRLLQSGLDRDYMKHKGLFEALI